MAINITMYVVWIIIAVVAIIIELHTVAQVGWAASIGAVAALIAHGVTSGDPIWVELTTFATVWVLSWLVLFLIIKPLRHKIHDKEDGYLDFIDNEYKVTKPNTEEYGEVRANGKYFRFISEEKIEKGETVKVISIKGVTFKVEKVE